MMRALIVLVVLVGAGLAVRQLLAGGLGGLAQHCARMMGRFMESMPDEAPPKQMMSTLRRIEETNEELLALLRERTPA